MQIEEVRSGLANRLRERRPEIEQAILTRVHSVADSSEGPDPEYTEGLRVAVTAALELGIDAVERSEDRPPSIPTALLSQSRLAARHGIKLETVLRRYLAGYTLLGDFLIEESERGGQLNGASLKRLLRVLAGLLDRLVAAVSEEYAREERGRLGSAEQRRAERVEGLLAGELLEAAELEYDFAGQHLGVVAAGPGATEGLQELAAALDRRPLLVPRGKTTVWAWLGSRQATDPAEVERLVPATCPEHVSLAVGEPAEGLGGWRLTHRQAKAALPIALRGPESFVRYADVAVLASICRDELLVTSLRQLYLTPLSAGRDAGGTLRETLRAYFAADRNGASAAAALGVSRQTVTSRLQVVEELIGRSLPMAATEIDAALRLEAFMK